MRLQDIGAAIVKRLWIVIAILLVSALTAAVVARVQSPVYKVEISASATAPINRTTGLPDAMTQGAYVALMPSVANFAESVDVAEVVSRRLEKQGIQISPQELLKKVSAMPEANSTSMKITFTDGSPTRVVDIANAWGDTLELMTLKSEANEFFDESLKNLILNGNIVFTNRAVVPEKPTQPKPMAYLGLGVFVGLVLGLVLVVLIEYFDPHFRSTRETEESMGLPVLGVLPKVKGAQQGDLLTAFGENTLVWEAYAELRSGVILSLREKGGSLVAAPAVPFPAAPAAVANLAISIANSGRKTLLIDGDLRERALSRLLGREGSPGLSEVLEKDEDPRQKIVETGTAGLYFLPAGARSERSTDLVSLPAFAEELREQEEVFDQVVIYAPALQGSMDAAVITAQAGSCLVVIDAERCTRKMAEEAMHGIERMGIVPLGVALANVKVKEKGRERVKGEREATPAAAVKERKHKPGKAVGAAPSLEARPSPGMPARRERRAADIEEAAVAREAEPAREVAAPPPKPATAVYAPLGGKPSRADAEGTRAADEIRAEEPGGGGGAVQREAAAEAPVAVTGRAWRRAEREKAERPVVPKAGVSAADEGESRARERVIDEFRRKGEKGEPVPKTWLRGLTSDKPDVRESAAAAVTAYYHAFLSRYAIGDESVREITDTIIKMLRREGEFAAISEAEAQERLRHMLSEAGARFAGAPAERGPAVSESGPSVPAPNAVAAEAGDAAQRTGGAEVRSEEAEREGTEMMDEPEEFKLPEKRRFRPASRGEGKSARWWRGRGSQPRGVGEDGIDWE